MFDERSGSFIQKEQRRFERIYDAKIAALALFHYLEPAALATGLSSCTNLWREILPGHDHWTRLLEATGCPASHSITNGYLRGAFLQLFRPDTGQYRFTVAPF